MVFTRMESWFKLLRWYCITAMDLWVSIEDLLEGAPVVTTHWNCNRKDENLIRFGLMWKCYDMVQSLGLDSRPGVLPLWEDPK